MLDCVITDSFSRNFKNPSLFTHEKEIYYVSRSIVR